MTFQRVAISVILLTGFFVVSARAEEHIPVTNQVFDLHTLSYQREKVELPVVLAPEPPKPAPQAVYKTKPTLTPPDRIKTLIDAYFPEHARTRAYAIANCESGWNDQAVGDGHLQFMQNGIRYGASYGVFQIRYLKGRPAPEQLLDAEFNIRYAANLYNSSGWQPWTCARKV